MQVQEVYSEDTGPRLGRAQRAHTRQPLQEAPDGLLEVAPVAKLVTTLSRGLARFIDGGCIIRGRIDTEADLLTACAHASDAALAELQPTFAAHPHALAFACSAQVIQTGKPIRLPLVTSQVLRLWSLPPAWPYLDRHPIRSLLVNPLRSRRGVDATILVWREAPSRRLTDAHAQLLEQVSRVVAPVVSELSRQPIIGLRLPPAWSDSSRIRFESNQLGP